MPLSPAARIRRDAILSIPWTSEPMMARHPAGVDQNEISFLHDLALKSPKRAVPKILKCIERHPDYPTLRNYLILAYEGSGRKMEAAETLQQLVKDHPDYPFGRFKVALYALEAGDTEGAAAALGSSLDIRRTFPEAALFHLSEMRSFYAIAGIIHARRGEIDAAHGARAALETIDPNPEGPRRILAEIVLANTTKQRKELELDMQNRIVPLLAPLRKKPVHGTPPEFENDAVRNLYFEDEDLPAETIREILALPRESLLCDLSLLLDDCVARTPDFLNVAAGDEKPFAVFHALHLLAEIDGVEALPNLLGVLSLHPEEFDFWLGDFLSYSHQISRIVGGGLAECAAWLQSPGIHSRHKAILCEAIEALGRRDAARRDEAIAVLTGTLAFLLESPVEDNVLDTNFLSLLVCSLIDLRATGALPLIRAAYDRNLIEIAMVGSLRTVEGDIALPPDRVGKPPDIYAQYRDYRRDEELETPVPKLLRPDFGPPSGGNLYGRSTSPLLPGRNDLCPCGSGKKYKKCCMS